MAEDFVSLPPELLLQLFGLLAADDLARACSVCGLWKEVASTSSLWRRHALQRWKYLDEDTVTADEWRHVYVERSGKDTRMQLLVQEMRKSPETRPRARQDLLEMNTDIIDGLDALITRLSAFPAADLDYKYHASKVLAKIRENMLMELWENLLQLPESKRRIEDGALLVCLLEYPDLELSSLQSELDALAIKFETKMQLEGTSKEPLEILAALSDFLYIDMGFHGKVGNYNDPKNSFLNDLLTKKSGLPVTLSVLYAAIARRSGVKLEMVGTPAYFLVKYVSEDDDTETFIDSFDGGKFLTADECQELIRLACPGLAFRESFLNSIRTDEVWARMLRNLMERYKATNSDKLYTVIGIIYRLTHSPVELLARTKIRILNEDYEEALDDITLLEDFSVPPQGLDRQLVLDKIQETQNIVSPREKPEEVLYNIGDVFVHKELGYHAVIYGWDTKCNAPQSWQEQSGVNLLLRGVFQPFYKCLRHTDSRVWSLCYVAQENVAYKSPIQVDHPSVGKYFKGYDSAQQKFLPTEELLHRYPSM